jgi:two-component system cell cycle response regulator
LKILVADDDPVSRRLVERILQKTGYEVVTADNGVQALDKLLCSDGPRLALLDWMMPELDGLEVCRRVRSRHGESYIYIILLSSKLSNEDVVAGLEAGSDDYLTKPCNPEELKARLRAGQRILRLEDTLVEAREEMRFKATHDQLTGLWNHGAILSLLGSELSRSRQEHMPVSLLLCDLDHFKRVNDEHGHLAGDEILRQVASRLSDSVRTCDVVGRYGGEEFLVVLKGCAGLRLRELAERVRDAVACKPFYVEEVALSISLSVGALALEDAKAAMKIEPLLRKVDEALYLAKSSGRNQVIYADPLPPDNSQSMVQPA